MLLEKKGEFLLFSFLNYLFYLSSHEKLQSRQTLRLLVLPLNFAVQSIASERRFMAEGLTLFRFVLSHLGHFLPPNPKMSSPFYFNVTFASPLHILHPPSATVLTLFLK